MGDRWTISTPSEHSGYPSTNLSTDNTARYWSATGARASLTWIQGQSDVSSADRPLDLVAVLRMNRFLPTGPILPGTSLTANTYRIRVDSHPLADRIRPSFTISNLVNLTGSDADLLGPIDPPTAPIPSGYVTTKLESVSAVVGTSFRATLDNHHASERALTGTIKVRVHAVMSSGFDVPTLTVTVSPSSGTGPGSLTLQSTEQTGEGYILNYQFPASSLSVATATIRIDVAGSTSGGATPEYIGFEVYQDLAGVAFDSGVVTFSGEQIRELPGVTIPAGATWYVLVEFSDFCLVTLNTFNGTSTFTPINAVPFHAGRFIVADVFELQTTNDGWLYAPQSNGDAQPMRDGSERFPSTVMSWDEYEIKAESRTESQAVDDLLLGLYRAVDVRFPFLVIPHEDEPSHDRWVRFVPNTFELSGGGVKAGKEGMGRRWNFEARVKEHTERAGVRG